MIEINRCGLGESVDTIHSKVVGTELSIRINKELVQQDINRLESLKGTIGITDDTNINVLIRTLKKMIKSVDDEGSIELCWNKHKDRIIESYPIRMFNEVPYGINTCNYIELNPGENLIMINVQDMADLIAFEFMYEDLGESHESIETLMKDCELLGYNSASVLIDKFKAEKDSMYYLSKVMKISECPWVDTSNKVVYDYFNTAKFKADSYNKVVEYSCIFASLVIANNLIKKCIKSGTKFRLVMVTATTIGIIVETEGRVDIKNELLDSIAIQIFGRQLIVNADIQIL